MLEEGRHKARGVEAGLGYTSKGTEQVAVLLETSEGQRITWYGFFTEKTIDRTLESLRYLGWQGDDLTDLSGIDANEIEIVVEHEYDDRGEPRARVRWINGGGGLAMRETMPLSDAKAFAARMKGAAVASRQRAGAPAGASRPSNGQRPPPSRSFDGAPPPTDDDIPF